MWLDRTSGGSCRYSSCPVAVARSHAAVGEAADLAVAQPVEDEGQQLAGGGDAADVATPAGADTGFDRGDLGVAYSAGDRFDSGPAQQARALFGDPAAGDVAVGLAVAWGQPCP